MKVGSVFSGIGGFDLGFERAGFDIAWSVEIDKHCDKVLRLRFPKVARYTDVTTVKGAELEDVDVLVGGFPCQDVSISGRREGMGVGTRSGLFFEFMRLVEEKKPKFVVIENVPGLLSGSDEDEDAAEDEGDAGPVRGSSRELLDGTAAIAVDRTWMGAVLGNMADLGYSGAWRMLDSQYFGVAQRRRRVFFVLGLGGLGAHAEAILLEPESGGGNPAPRRKTREGTAETLTAGARVSGRRQEDDYNLTIDDVAGTLGSKSGGSRSTDLDGHGAYVVAGTLRAQGGGPDVDAARAGHYVVPPLTAKMAKGTGGPAGDEVQNLITAPMVYDEQQITNPDNRSNPQPGDPCTALTPAMRPLLLEPMGFNATTDASDLAPTLSRGSDGDNAPAVVFPIQADASRAGTALNPSVDAAGISRLRDPGLGIGEAGDPSYTLTATAPGSVGGRTIGVRRLTPLECERLQFFPDGWTCLCGEGHKGSSFCSCPDTPRYRGLGNAVTVSVITWLANRMKAVLA